jgi:hypothetical protein
MSRHSDTGDELVYAEPDVTPGRGYVVKDGRLPVNEALFDRAGAPSPFGDDIVLPLSASELSYVHPLGDAAPQHL